MGTTYDHSWGPKKKLKKEKASFMGTNNVGSLCSMWMMLGPPVHPFSLLILVTRYKSLLISSLAVTCRCYLVCWIYSDWKIILIVHLSTQSETRIKIKTIVQLPFIIHLWKFVHFCYGESKNTLLPKIAEYNSFSCTKIWDMKFYEGILCE